MVKAKTVRTGATQRKPRTSDLQKKIVLLLLGGLALGLTRNPKKYFKVVHEIHSEWQKVNRNTLNRAINSLYKSKLVTTKDNHDGTLTLVLSKTGKKVALTYNIEDMGIKRPTRWDGKWHIVMFDVPEPYKKIRDSLRMHFKNMGFYEFQKSVFVHPYPCGKEIEYLMEFYQSRKYVRYIVATEIDNAIELKKHFDLM